MLNEKGGGGVKKIMKCVRMALPVLTLFLVFGIFDREGVVLADGPAQVERPLIALTFDDGPLRVTTESLLEGLEQRGVNATFFLIGDQIVGNEDLVRRMEEQGHQIGIHTYDHVILTGLNRADFDAQVEKSRGLLEGLLGHDGFLLRPPYGMLDEGVRTMAGSPIILWSVDPEDWRDKNAERVARHIVKNAFDGAIILLHDIYPQSVQAALQAVDELHRQGYLFVTVDQLFAARGIELEAGEIYRMAKKQ